jgi:hypothetical protein
MEHVVTVKDLPALHPLHGEKGLFAAVEFEIFDVIGSYTGAYVNKDARGFPNMKLIRSGHYLARLDGMELGINAEDCGNEMRYINSYLNISDGPNCVMRTTFINRTPHILIICIRSIAIGTEILLDYGADYNTRYILPKPFQSKVTTAEELWNELPPPPEDDET